MSINIIPTRHETFRAMALGALTHSPNQGHPSVFTDHVKHQSTTAPGRATAIHHHHSEQGQATQEQLGVE